MAGEFKKLPPVGSAADDGAAHAAILSRDSIMRADHLGETGRTVRYSHRVSLAQFVHRVLGSSIANIIHKGIYQAINKL
jgi:hypothetical protein